jgi:hypothetical protein
LHQYRFEQNPNEKSYALVWEDRNLNVVTGYPDGRGTLDYLLAEDCNSPSGEVSERDREVAATVIQWLGSPVGQGFVEDVQSKIKERNGRAKKRRLKK